MSKLAVKAALSQRKRTRPPGGLRNEGLEHRCIVHRTGEGNNGSKQKRRNGRFTRRLANKEAAREASARQKEKGALGGEATYNIRTLAVTGGKKGYGDDEVKDQQLGCRSSDSSSAFRKRGDLGKPVHCCRGLPSTT